MSLEKFNEFTEDKAVPGLRGRSDIVKPYEILMFSNKLDDARDVTDGDSNNILRDLMFASAKKAGIKIHFVDFNGLHVERKGGKTFIHSYDFGNGEDGLGYGLVLPNAKGELEKPKQKPIEINPKNTIILARGLGTPGMTNIQTWTDMIHEFEYEGYLTIPTIDCWYKCCSKYLTDILCRRAGLRTPKTIPISYSDDTSRVMKEHFNDKFPIILKTSTGSQTGVGVLIMESMRSLNSTVQMLKLYENTLPVVLQEYIKTDHDIRVIILDGKVKAVMKREVIQGDDFRSNVSLGAATDEYELTDLEREDSIKAAGAVGGRLVGVDFIPAKNREKEQPYILEVNSMPGFGGIEKIEKGMTQEIMEYFKNRDNWSFNPLDEGKIQIDSMEVYGDTIIWTKDGIEHEHEVYNVSKDNNPIIEYNSQEVELIPRLL